MSSLNVIQLSLQIKVFRCRPSFDLNKGVCGAEPRHCILPRIVWQEDSRVLVNGHNYAHPYAAAKVHQVTTRSAVVSRIGVPL